MRQFVTLFVLLLVSVPFGISISGCGKKDPVVFCNASSGNGGVLVGQLNSITLQPAIFGLSLNYGQINSLLPPTGADCKGTVVTPKSWTYGSQDTSIVDVNPTTGDLCAGSWNRNLNVIPDYTVCTPPAHPDPKRSMTYVTAEADGVTSNPVPVFTHPVITSVVLGESQPCSAQPSNDQTTNCCPLAANNTITATPYSGNQCVSQGQTRQLAARVFTGTGTYNSTTGTTSGSLQNISCQAGHLSFATQTPSIATIDENGVITAQQPGSTIITASISNAGSSDGFFSTCPPTSISLAVPNNSATHITIGQNFVQPLVATVLDQNNTTLTGLALQYVSTTPTTIAAAAGGTVTPAFPGAASITAICQPPSCNPSPVNQIGFLGNGKPITSNPIGITTPGTTSSLLYIASTQSRYLVPIDFTTKTLGAPVQLPYVPNSMVISEDGSTIYMGSSTALMIFSATANGLKGVDQTVPGVVLAVSPDNSTVAIADTARKLVYLDVVNIDTTTTGSTGTGTTTAGGATGGSTTTGGTTTGTGATSGLGVSTSYGAIGTRAQWSPDSQTVYITTADTASGTPQALVYSSFTGWHTVAPPVTPQDVTVTVPNLGAYFAGAQTSAVGYCPATTLSTSNGDTIANNVFYPQADDQSAIVTDRLAATNDGKHILGATASTKTLSDLFLTLPSGPCPSSGGALQFTSVPNNVSLAGIAPTAITGVLPTSDSTEAVVTYLGTGGILPAYAPSNAGTATPGALTNIPLTNGATAPVAGVWSSDNLTFFAGTSGDNAVHLITRGNTTSPLTDSQTITPKLPLCDATTLACPNPNQLATPNLLASHPRKTS